MARSLRSLPGSPAAAPTARSILAPHLKTSGCHHPPRQRQPSFPCDLALNHAVGTAEDVAAALAPSDWQRLSAGTGTKGPRVYDRAYVELADLDAQAQGYPGSHGLWTRGLLVRRSIADGACAFFATWCHCEAIARSDVSEADRASTGIGTLVAVEGQRWTIEDSFETAKTEFGLDHHESRSWHGWHRHVSLVCWRLSCWQPFATTRTQRSRGAIRARRLPRKLRPARLMRAKPYPLVAAGNSPRRHPPCANTHPAGPRHCLVTLATRAPGRRAALTYETKCATVMLGAGVVQLGEHEAWRQHLRQHPRCPARKVKHVERHAITPMLAQEDRDGRVLLRPVTL